MEETKWLTKGKIISIVVILLTIVGIVTAIFVHRSNLKKEYIKLETNLELISPNYLRKERITLEKNEWKKIKLKELVNYSSMFNKYLDSCDGYVIAESYAIDEDNSDVSYTAYVSCGKIYETQGYGGLPDKEKENTEKTQSENDTEKPIINLFGEKEITLEYGEKYEELGATAVDNVDGDITKKIKISGKVDNKKAGTYVIKYTVSDKSKNKTTAKRKVIVKEEEKDKTEEKPNTTVPEVQEKPTPTPQPKPQPKPTPQPARDTTNPILTFYDSSAYQTICKGDKVNIQVNGPYGYVARDNVDGDITSRVVISGNTGNMYSIGTYTINYRVSDSSGNTTYSTRNFSVKDCSTTIKKPTSKIEISSVGLTPNIRTISVNSQLQLELTIVPSNATNKSVTYSSSNPSVASVSSTGLVRAISKGTTTIKVRTSNGKTAISNITVN